MIEKSSPVIPLLTFIGIEAFAFASAFKSFQAGINKVALEDPDAALLALRNTANGISQNSSIPRICERADLIQVLNCWHGGVEHIGQTINFYGQMIQTVINHPQTLIPILSQPENLIGTAMVLTPIIIGGLWLSRRNH